MEVSCRVLHKAFSCRLLHVILYAKVCTLGDRREYPSHHHAAPSWHLRAPGTRGHRGSPVQPSLKRPVFRSACSHRSSWEMPRAFGSTMLLTVFSALGIGLFAQGNIADTKHRIALRTSDDDSGPPYRELECPAKAKRRQTTRSTRNASFLWCLAGPNRSRARLFPALQTSPLAVRL